MKYKAKECTCWIEYPNESHKKANGQWKCVDDYVCVRPLSVRKCNPPCKDFPFRKTKCVLKEDKTMDEIICNECGKVFHPGDTNGLPNGVGFMLSDGTVWNVCAECLMKIGEALEKGGKNEQNGKMP